MLQALTDFLKSFWLKYPRLGLRKIILMLTTTTALSFATKYLDGQLYLVTLTISFAFLALILVSAAVKGFYHRLALLSEKGETYEIFDFILPLNTRVSTRNLGTLGTYRFVLSSAFKSRSENEKRSAYLNIVTQIFKIFFSKRTAHASLVIGGGTLSLPLFFVNNYKKHKTTVVEPEKTQIAAATKYFYPLFARGHDRIKTINSMGQAFLSAKPFQKFNFILLDAFVNEQVVEELLLEKSLKSLIAHLKPNGIGLINLYLVKKNLPSLVRLVTTLNKLHITPKLIFNPENGHALTLFSPNKSIVTRRLMAVKIGNYQII